MRFPSFLCLVGSIIEFSISLMNSLIVLPFLITSKNIIIDRFKYCSILFASCSSSRMSFWYVCGRASSRPCA